MTIWRIVATFFYLGKSPFAPGTCGSLGALLLWLLIPITFLFQFSIIVFLFILGVYSSNKIANHLDDKDPNEIVIDEAVGMGISLFMLPHNIGLYVLAFFLFRIIDIYKPLFISRIEDLPGGWGIMLDDVMAGLLTFAIVNGIFIVL